MNYDKVLDEFIKQQQDGCLAGSGDDQAYVDGVKKYINEQRKVWIDFAKFVEMIKRTQ